MAMTSAEKTKAFRDREKVKREQARATASDKHARLFALITQAQELAREINAEMVADLQSQPMTRETLRALDAIENREERISFAKV